jgi:hypothetical protein
MESGRRQSSGIIPMSDAPLFFRNKSFVSDSIGDDTILVNIHTGAYYSLTPLAGRVWNSLGQSPLPLPQDTHPVAATLLEEGLIGIQEGATIEAVSIPADELFIKYTDMADILMADPIHDVDDDGWPILR